MTVGAVALEIAGDVVLDPVGELSGNGRFRHPLLPFGRRGYSDLTVNRKSALLSVLDRRI